MPEVAPLLLHKHGEAVQRAVVRVDQDLRDGRQLSGAVPAIAAVHKHRDFTDEQLRNPDATIKDGADQPASGIWETLCALVCGC